MSKSKSKIRYKCQWMAEDLLVSGGSFFDETPFSVLVNSIFRLYGNFQINKYLSFKPERYVDREN